MADDISKVQSLRDQAADTSAQAAGLTATGYSLGDMVMDQIRQDRAQRGVSKLAESEGVAMGRLVSGPQNIRDFSTQEGYRMDPLNVDYYTSRDRAQTLKTLGTVSRQAELNQGSLDEVIQAGANQLYGRAAMMEAQAKQEREKADSLMQRLQWESAEKTAELQRQKMQLDIDSYNSGSGTAGIDWPSILTQDQGGEELTEDPEFTPIDVSPDEGVPTFWEGIKNAIMPPQRQRVGPGEQDPNAPIDMGNPYSQRVNPVEQGRGIINSVKDWYNEYKSKQSAGSDKYQQYLKRAREVGAEQARKEVYGS